MEQRTIVICGTSTRHAFEAINELNRKIRYYQEDGYKTEGAAQVIYDNTCYTGYITMVKE